MGSPGLLLGAVAYDPKVVTIWEGFRSWFREQGLDVDFSCMEGICGSCRVRVLEGELDHRDSFLNSAQKAAGDAMMICVSRAAGPTLTLDL